MVKIKESINVVTRSQNPFMELTIPFKRGANNVLHFKLSKLDPRPFLKIKSAARLKLSKFADETSDS